MSVYDMLRHTCKSHLWVTISKSKRNTTLRLRNAISEKKTSGKQLSMKRRNNRQWYDW